MIANIQFLRAIAATAVVFQHITPHYLAAGGSNEFLAWTFGHGRLGVDLFFVISGFIMWRTSEEQDGPEAATRFLGRRLVRIYGGYWPALALYGALLLLWPDPNRADADLVGSLLLTERNHFKLLIPVAWSLNVELYFYLMFALGLALGRAWVVAIFLTLSATVVLVSLRVLPMWALPARIMALPWTLEFAAGVFLAAALPRLAGWRALLPLGLAGLAAGVAALDLVPPRLGRVALPGAGAVLLVYAAVWLEHRRAVRAPAFLVLCGDASYALYLLHIPLLHLYAISGAAGIAGDLGVPAALSTVAVVLAMIGLSVLHYRHVERPSHQFLRSCLGGAGAAMLRWKERTAP